MAQADSVRTSIPRLITDATSKASTKPYSTDQVDLGATSGGSEYETTLLQPRREKRNKPKPEDLSANSTGDLNPRWYKTVTGRMTISWYSVAVCYATFVILLGWLPWNALLILLLFSNSERLRFGTFETTPSDKLGSPQ
jgi:hypothetical protein